jgi:Glycosyl hydrolase family 79 C-terminal beta domain
MEKMLAGGEIFRRHLIFMKAKMVKLLALIALLQAPVTVLNSNAEPAEAKAQVIIHSEKPGTEIPADFLGFSNEKKILSRDCFDPTNAVLVQLFQNLGTGVLRIGGHAVESTFWSRNETNPLTPMADKRPYEQETPITIGPLSVDNLFAFAKASGWRVIYGLNLGASKPDMAADEADYAVRAGGSSLLALEVGNEPNLFHTNAKKKDKDAKDLNLAQLRPNGYSYAQYRDEIETYYEAILAKCPHAPLTGPATTKSCSWVPDFVRDFKNQIVLVTSHGYPLSAKDEDPKSPRLASIENLLSVNIEEDWLPKLKAATSAGIPWRLGEFNTASGGGKHGLSDVFASALWGTDFFFKVAEQGAAGINLHGGFTPGRYSPIYFLDNGYHAAPIYYSMLLFHQAAQGRLVPVECQTRANFTAHAILGDDHKLRVVLINKDLTNSVIAFIAAGSSCTKAEVIRLSAPSVRAVKDITLAGSAVAEDGTWTPQPGESMSCASGRCAVTLPAASAALLIIN